MADNNTIDQFDLRSRLQFNSETGRIWLDEHRMLMMHARSVGALRKELFEQLGEQRAKVMLWRAGFEGGQLDAEMAVKMLGGDADNDDVFLIGPSIHGLEGIVQSTIVQNDADWEEGVFRGRVEMRNSWEAESHLQLFGETDDVACWSVMGYASGYTSRFFQSFIVFKESQCVCAGHDHCKMEGRPVDEWGDDPTVAMLRGVDEDFERFAIESELCGLRKAAFAGEAKRERPSTGNLVGESQEFLRAFDLLAKAAPSPITVMLLGETGVGKEVFARWLHDHSPRKDEPFIAVNCGAIPVELIESELFGVRKGAYTGADQSRPGRFERADGGTLFLDEVGDLPPAAQVKLLRAIQTGEVERLGDDQVRKVNVRIVSATNSNLKQAMSEGKFRQDLYYRLSTYPVEIPPLRERANDIAILAHAMIEKFSEPYGKSITGLTDRAIRVLRAYDWPGNVRELENTIERGVLLCEDGHAIEAHHLFPAGLPVQAEGARLHADGQVKKVTVDENGAPDWKSMIADGFSLDDLEKQLVDTAISMSDGNVSEAARLLGLTRRQMDYKLKNMEKAEASAATE